MSRAHSVASKARWANIPKKERSKRMSLIAKRRMQKYTPAQRKNIALGLVAARRKKAVQ